MRKYQQLLLLVICAFCIWFLFMYRNENNRLKIVLQAINFFGRNDAEVLRQIQTMSAGDATTTIIHPIPVWRSIGESHYAYSAFWIRNELISGGEALAIVIGSVRADVNFKCCLIYDSGSRIVQGKFRFQRINDTTEHKNQEFMNYNFICRLTKDFGKPEFVTFTENSPQNRSVNIRLRHTKISNSDGQRKPQLTVCLDLINGQTKLNILWNDIKYLQFFFHISKLGVRDVLVYNGEVIPENTLRVLKKLKIQVHLMPFNFPYRFEDSNGKNYIRHSMNTDCLLRNTPSATSTLLLKENEFVFLKDFNILFEGDNYESDNAVERLEIFTFNTCMDPDKKLLIDNSKYDPEIKSESKIYLHRPVFSPYATYSEKSFKSSVLPLANAFAHRYIKCEHVNAGGLHNWNISLHQDFNQHVQNMRAEINSFIDEI